MSNSGNPRKFSDKLEIIRRKEEEANAAFRKIMIEVSDAKTGLPPVWGRGQNEANMRQRYKGGSLPDVNITQLPMGGYPPGALEFYGPPHAPHLSGQPHNYINPAPSHSRRAMEPPSGPIYPTKGKIRSYTVAPYRNSLHHQSPNLLPEPQNDSQNPMWRRTFSDSAIHQTLQQPPKKNPDGTPQQGASPRIVQPNPLPTVVAGNENAQFQSSQQTHSFNGDPSRATGKKVQMQANTSSLPDLSNLSIPSPIQNPIDIEQEGKSEHSDQTQQQQHQQQQQQQHAFQVPYRVPTRVGKQIYSRQLGSSNPDVMESLQRDSKLPLNLYSTGVMNADKNDPNKQNMNNSISHSAPLSPVTPSTPPPYYWNTTPMSPLATSDLMQQQQVSGHNEIQQQFQNFQIHSDSTVQNGIGNPPPYPFMNDTSPGNSFNNYHTYNKQMVYRINSGPAQFSTSKEASICDKQLDSELLKLKAQDEGSGHELSEADLDSVRVALDPLDFNDVRILTGENEDLVEQSTEEGFRLEGSGFQ